jgi:hypothetical protein
MVNKEIPELVPQDSDESDSEEEDNNEPDSKEEGDKEGIAIEHVAFPCRSERIRKGVR